MAVRWYLRYGLSYRDVEELLAERGVEVDHVTVCRWVQRLHPLLADAAQVRPVIGGSSTRPTSGSVVSGATSTALSTSHGQVIDVLVSKRRDGPLRAGSSQDTDCDPCDGDAPTAPQR